MCGRALSVVSGSFLALCLCAAPAESQEGTVYLQVDYMKASSPEYVQIESSIWKPIHEERIRRGQLRSWALYGVRFGDRHAYDYVTINVATDLDHFDGWGASFQDIARAAHPGKDLAEITNTLRTREVVRSELWRLSETLEPQQFGSEPPAEYLQVAFMDVPAAGVAEYLRLERDVWKPIHRASVGRGASAGWGVYELLWPGGSRAAYNFAALNSHSRLAPWPFAELVAAAHPGVPVEEVIAQTSEARDMVATLMLYLVDATR